MCQLVLWNLNIDCYLFSNVLFSLERIIHHVDIWQPQQLDPLSQLYLSVKPYCSSSPAENDLQHGQIFVWFFGILFLVVLFCFLLFQEICYSQLVQNWLVKFRRWPLGKNTSLLLLVCLFTNPKENKPQYPLVSERAQPLKYTKNPKDIKNLLGPVKLPLSKTPVYSGWAR